MSIKNGSIISMVPPFFDEWNKGDRAWLIDIVAPFGGSDSIIEEIKKSVFPDRAVKSLNVSPESGISVKEW